MAYPTFFPATKKSPGWVFPISGGTTTGRIGTGGQATITGGAGGTGTRPTLPSPSKPAKWSDGKRTIEVGKKYYLEIPDKQQHLAPSWSGKTVTVSGINGQGCFNIEVSHPFLQGTTARNICAVEPSWLKPVCTCPVGVLMFHGCRCGGV